MVETSWVEGMKAKVMSTLSLIPATRPRKIHLEFHQEHRDHGTLTPHCCTLSTALRMFFVYDFHFSRCIPHCISG